MQDKICAGQAECEEGTTDTIHKQLKGVRAVVQRQTQNPEKKRPAPGYK
jgi:hypothetical protein